MMILYHMSDFLKVGTELTLDYKKNEYLIDPFVKALNISTAMFQSMLLKVAEGTVPLATPHGLEPMVRNLNSRGSPLERPLLFG